jgi:hypothetical protein
LGKKGCRIRPSLEQARERRPKRPIPAAVAAIYYNLGPGSPTVSIVGATIHTVTKGDVPNGTLVFSKGKITAVGAHVPTAGVKFCISDR